MSLIVLCCLLHVRALWVGRGSHSRAGTSERWRGRRAQGQHHVHLCQPHTGSYTRDLSRWRGRRTQGQHHVHFRQPHTGSYTGDLSGSNTSGVMERCPRWTSGEGGSWARDFLRPQGSSCGRGTGWYLPPPCLPAHRNLHLLALLQLFSQL